MLSNDAIRLIADIFIGDEYGYYSYKKGEQLVEFFNKYFQSNDVYESGFPSRWNYVADKIKTFIVYNMVDSFFNNILSLKYLMFELKISEVQAADKATEIFNRINQILIPEQYKLTYLGNEYHFVQIDEDLIPIGEGGFANVYKQLSTGLVIKKLKSDFLSEHSIRSRFKREYEITKSLSDMEGIIQVFSFENSSCQYTMEEADTTLEKYLTQNNVSLEVKEETIRQILTIMSEVHKRDIIHRDLSPNNIFLISEHIKIADFGLGKDLNVFTSNQTIYTKEVGQYFYCAPEQFMMLKGADKRSDVYSLGRIINFIMTGKPTDSHHIFSCVTEKATNSDSVYRYGDASQLLIFFEKSVQYHNDEQNEERILDKMRAGVYDTDLVNYIYDMSSEDISKMLLRKTAGFKETLIKFMKENDSQAQHIIQNIEKSFRIVCKGSYEANDVFASFADDVLRDSFSYSVKEIAAIVLRCVAWEVNRYYAQRLVDSLIEDSELEPMLEDIIKS